MYKPISLHEFIELTDAGILNQGLLYHKLNQKDIEKENFYKLAKLILENMNECMDVEGFFLGADIEIVPDFDIVRFTEGTIINIDLKSEYVEEDRIIKKFKQQSRILSLLDKKFESFVYYDKYIDGNYRIKKFDIDNNRLVDSTIGELILNLHLEEKVITHNLIECISPSQYIISPTEDVDLFMKGKYFLTDTQEKCGNEIMKKHNLYGVEGVAGTGKTLVALDMVKKLSMQGSKVLFIFAGNLRENHKEIASRIGNVDFKSAKYIPCGQELDSYNYIIVDEAQRLYEEAFHECVNWWEKWKHSKSKSLILFYHIDQQLSKKERGGIIEKYCKTNGELKKLSKRIRSNKYISAFVEKLRNKGSNISKKIELNNLMEHIDVYYCSEYDQAERWIKGKIVEGYKFLVPTEDKYRKSSVDSFRNMLSLYSNTHEVIGSEFDKVVTYIDSNVGYQGGKLEKRNYEYYFLENEIYVNMSRAREKLALVIINNPEIYKYIMSDIFKLEGR